MFLVARENLVFNDDHLPFAVFNADVDPASRVFSLLANVPFTGSPRVGRVKLFELFRKTSQKEFQEAVFLAMRPSGIQKRSDYG